MNLKEKVDQIVAEISDELTNTFNSIYPCDSGIHFEIEILDRATKIKVSKYKQNNLLGYLLFDVSDKNYGHCFLSNEEDPDLILGKVFMGAGLRIGR